MICDAHVHVGYFRDQYFSPDAVIAGLRKLKVHQWAVSSSSTSGKPWSFVRKEYERIVELAPDESVLLLWVTPAMLKHSGDLSVFSILPFRGIKIHWTNGWNPHGKQMERLFSIAQERQWPIVVHTGVDGGCQAGEYEAICHKYSSVRVVLAHGRPIDQAASLMKSARNVWADTSFMPNRDIHLLASQGVAGKVLHGSDYPAPTVFYKTPICRYYQRRLMALRTLGNSAYQNITANNFNRIYGQ